MNYISSTSNITTYNNVSNNDTTEVFNSSSNNTNINNDGDCYGNVQLDLNPDNYPKKYKKFVPELTILIDNIKLANVSSS